MPPKRQALWDDLHFKMGAKRTRADTGKRGKNATLPHEVVVQWLAAEPDNKQTFKPVSPREFVAFEQDELNLTNLKRTCANHFNLPSSSCDVLVSNKGPSCTNINQIPHRKDKVYLVRFVLIPDHDFHEELEEVEDVSYPHSLDAYPRRDESVHQDHATETKFPASISIGELLKAGKLVRPKPKECVVLQLEQFDVETSEWHQMPKLAVETTKFASGAFRDAYKGEVINKEGGKKLWVVKTYNDRANTTIKDDLLSSVESHTRKQVQMHEVARHLTKGFSLKVPTEFGECFSYNHVYYTKYKDVPATVEEFIPGTFMKYVNNDGNCTSPPETSSDECKEVYAKAETLVHYSYCATNKKMMIMDIQGSMYHLYDPEIATESLQDVGENEIYFCCGNLASVGIKAFLDKHICNKYCSMMGLPLE